VEYFVHHSSTARFPFWRNVFAALAVLAMSMLAAVAGALPAAAHAALSGSDPAEGSTVTAPPQRVSLTFNEAVTDLGVALVVTGPDGTALQQGEPAVDDREVSIKVRSLQERGVHQIKFRVVSADGHPIQGQIAFTYAGPVASDRPTPTTPTASSTSPQGSTPAASGSSSLPAPVDTDATASVTGRTSSSTVATAVSPDPEPVADNVTPTPSRAAVDPVESDGGTAQLWIVVGVVAALIVAVCVAVVAMSRHREK